MDSRPFVITVEFDGISHTWTVEREYGTTEAQLTDEFLRHVQVFTEERN